MKNRHAASRPFRFWGMGKIRLGLFFIAFVTLSSFVALLVISAMSAHFAYASAKSVPIPPKRPDVMSASPGYIRQLMARDSLESAYGGSYEVEKMASLQNTDSQMLSEMLDNGSGGSNSYVDYNYDDIAYSPEITDTGIPIPGRKPSYGADSLVQRIEDFSNNPSSVQLTLVEPEAGGDYSASHSSGEDYKVASASGVVLQPIVDSSQRDSEKALVSFTLDPDQVSLDPNLKNFLSEHAVKQFKDDPNLRLEIQAYASTEDEQAYSDVRRSLARALEVRSFLLEQNIDPSRLKITPMGQDVDNVTDDRIDLLFIVSKR